MGHVSFDLARRLRPTHRMSDGGPDTAVVATLFLQSSSGTGTDLLDVVAFPRDGERELPDPAAGPVESAVAERGSVDHAMADRGGETVGIVAGDRLEDLDETAAGVATDDAAAAAWPTPTWEEIVQQHSARIFRLAYRLTGNRHDAEDLTQDVFVRVFRALPTFTPGNFEAWIHRITTNLFLDGARRRQRIRFDALDPEAGERLPDPAAGPEERYHLSNLDGDVRTALLALRPEFRAAVVLADIEGLPYDEVAAALGIKLGTVRSRIHRGRAQLREQLAHRAPIGRAPAIAAARAAEAPDGTPSAPATGGRVGSLVSGVGVALGT